MARRYRTRTRTVYRTARRSYRRARGIAGGKFGGVIAGAVAGFAGGLASKFLGSWGQPAANIGVGYFMKNQTLMTIGGMQLGNALTSGGGLTTGTTLFNS